MKGGELEMKFAKRTIIFVAILTVLMSMSAAVYALDDDEPPTVAPINLHKK